MSEVIVQQLAKTYQNPIDKAIIYYSVISALNNLKLQKREIELLAFTSIRGTITPISAREEFIKQFGSSLATIENMKGKLVKIGLLVKDGEMYRVAPAIRLLKPDVDWTWDDKIVLKINLI